MNRTVAITGGTGFAGRHAVAELLRRGHRLRALVRTPAKADLPQGVETVAGDLSDPSALARLTAGADAVDEGDAVAISVCDDGDGIAADDLEAIFERFRRADPSRAAVDGSGSGLGLTIARAIIRAHGGTLRATSDGVGHGATFTVRLPAPTSR